MVRERPIQDIHTIMPIAFPASTITISVKAIDVASTETEIPAAFFLAPVPAGREACTMPTYAFLLEHPSGKRVMFDLGMRKGHEGFSPAILGSAKLWLDLGMRGPVVDKDIIEQLAEGGLSPADIDTVIWRYDSLAISLEASPTLCISVIRILII